MEMVLGKFLLVGAYYIFFSEIKIKTLEILTGLIYFMKKMLV